MDDKKLPNPLTRRQFLKLSLGTAAAVTIPVTIAGCAPTPIPTPPDTLTPGAATDTPTPSATPISETFVQPKEIKSEAGVLATSLLVKFKPTSLISGGQTLVRMYGSPKSGVTQPDPENDDDWDFALPGPTWRLKVGDRIKLTLYNRLTGNDSVEACEPEFYPTATPTPAGTPSATPPPNQTPTATAFPDEYPDCFHENNATNIHYHGLHVDQGPHADDVFITLYPKDQQNPPPPDECVQIGEYAYDFQVPEDHPQGTFWYHPHKHGSVTLQVANGMSGTIIIEDTLKDNPVFKGQLKEYVLVFQTLQPTINFPVDDKNPRIFAVNGVQANTAELPEITLKVGEVQRWRIVNATFQDQTDFNLQFTPTSETTAAEPEVYFMAMDGYFLPEDRWQKGTNKAEWFYSAPGNRTDFLVKGVEEGTFILQGEPNTTGPASRGQKVTPTPTRPRRKRRRF